MKRSITGRHFELTEAIKEYVQAAVDVIDKYNLDITTANTVIIKSEKKRQFIVFNDHEGIMRVMYKRADGKFGLY